MYFWSSSSQRWAVGILTSDGKEWQSKTDRLTVNLFYRNSYPEKECWKNRHIFDTAGWERGSASGWWATRAICLQMFSSEAGAWRKPRESRLSRVHLESGNEVVVCCVTSSDVLRDVDAVHWDEVVVCCVTSSEVCRVRSMLCSEMRCWCVVLRRVMCVAWCVAWCRCCAVCSEMKWWCVVLRRVTCVAWCRCCALKWGGVL